MTPPKRMSAEERANGITGYDIGARCKSTFQEDEAHQWLVEQIKAAEEQGREEGVREAAFEAEFYSVNLANKIRALNPSEQANASEAPQGEGKP